MTLARLIFARFLAVVLLLQGVGPAFLGGVLRPGGWLLACLAVIYTALAVGVWQRRRWALPAAFAITLPQLVVISSSWFSWQFFVLAGRGFGFLPRDTFYTSYFFAYRSSGCGLTFALGYSKHLLADCVFGQPTFVLINVLVVPLLTLLLVVLVSDLYVAAFPPVPNHALQRTEAGGMSSPSS